MISVISIFLVVFCVSQNASNGTGMFWPTWERRAYFWDQCRLNITVPFGAHRFCYSQKAWLFSGLPGFFNSQLWLQRVLSENRLHGWPKNRVSRAIFHVLSSLNWGEYSQFNTFSDVFWKTRATIGISCEVSCSFSAKAMQFGGAVCLVWWPFLQRGWTWYVAW